MQAKRSSRLIQIESSFGDGDQSAFEYNPNDYSSSNEIDAYHSDDYAEASFDDAEPESSQRPIRRGVKWHDDPGKNSNGSHDRFHTLADDDDDDDERDDSTVEENPSLFHSQTGLNFHGRNTNPSSFEESSPISQTRHWNPKKPSVSFANNNLENDFNIDHDDNDYREERLGKKFFDNGNDGKESALGLNNAHPQSISKQQSSFLQHSAGTIETSKPTAFKLIPSSYIKNGQGKKESSIVGYKSAIYNETALVATLDEECNLRLVDIRSQRMKMYAIGVVNPILSSLDNFEELNTGSLDPSLMNALGDAFQKVMIRPFTDWTLYGEGKMLLVQKFDNKIHFLNLNGVLDIDDEDSLEEVIEAYTSRNLIQIAAHDSPISVISIQLASEEVDPSSIRNERIKNYVLISGTDYGEIKVWSVRDGDPPLVKCLFNISTFTSRVTSACTALCPHVGATRLLAFASAQNQELKAFDVMTKQWVTERPIEASPVTVMKILTIRNGEQILATVNAMGTILLYYARNLSLFKSFYVNLNGNHFQVTDICTFVDPNTNKDVFVIPCTFSKGEKHFLKFFVDGALTQEFSVSFPILYCNIFDNIHPSQRHLVVGNNAGLIDAWNIYDIFPRAESGDGVQSESEDLQESNMEERHSRLEQEFEDTFATEEGSDDGPEPESLPTYISEPPRSSSPTFQPRDTHAIPKPMRDSRALPSQHDHLVLDESFNALPRSRIPTMEEPELWPTPPPQPHSKANGKVVQFELPPQTPRERDNAPIQISKADDSPFLMPRQTTSNQKQFQHPSFPNQPSAAPSTKSKVKRHIAPSTSPSKRINYRNPKEFMNILEQQAMELESAVEIPEHPLAKPQSHSTRILTQKILELENEVFDPEKYMKEKNLLVERDATIHAYQIDSDRVLYNSLPSVNAPVEVSRTRKRKVGKQVSETYLEEQRATAPVFDELIFFDELNEEIKCDVDASLFACRKVTTWRENAQKNRENVYVAERDEENPLGTPLSHHIGHRWVTQFMKNPHWFFE